MIPMHRRREKDAAGVRRSVILVGKSVIRLLTGPLILPTFVAVIRGIVSRPENETPKMNG